MDKNINLYKHLHLKEESWFKRDLDGEDECMKRYGFEDYFYEFKFKDIIDINYLRNNSYIDEKDTDYGFAVDDVVVIATDSHPTTPTSSIDDVPKVLYYFNVHVILKKTMTEDQLYILKLKDPRYYETLTLDRDVS